MSVRPSTYILVGIDNATKEDPRNQKLPKKTLDYLLYDHLLTEEECWHDDSFSDYHYACIKVPGFSLSLDDRIFNPRLWEYPKDVIGYITKYISHDDNMIRALATVDTRFEESGYFRIPTLDPVKHQGVYLHYGYTQEDVAHNLFVPSIFQSYPARDDWLRAQHYLGMVGWEIPLTDLRYLFVWSWS
jgi:hypothetical protein